MELESERRETHLAGDFLEPTGTRRYSVINNGEFYPSISKLVFRCIIGDDRFALTIANSNDPVCLNSTRSQV
jgi:hypothetical protein